MPVQVRIRKLADGALPRKLMPRGITYRWTMDWDETMRGTLTVTSVESQPPKVAPAPVAALPKPAQMVTAPAPRKAEPAPRLMQVASAPAMMEMEAPHLAIESGQSGPWARLSAAGKIGLALTLALVLAASAAWKWIGKPSAAEEGQATSVAARNPLAGLTPGLIAGPQGWLTEPAADPVGSAAGRRLTIYRPSLRLSNYVVDFNGYLQSKSLGWVFRYRDASNYYATKIEITRAGSMPEIALARWAVVDGTEIGRNRVPLPIVVHLDTLYRVRFEVRGPRFTTYIQGRPVDLWSDTRLREGAFGFMNDRAERAEIKSVQFSLSTESAGR